MLQLDSFYKLKTVATGLSDPRDLEVGTIGGNQGLLVVDSNSIVAYDASSFSRLISYPISGAGEIDDIVVDPSAGNTFYLSDVKNNKILKGKVGPPPFYTPTYTTLVSSGINRPKGMMLNSNGELIVVTDEPKAKIYKVNTTSGLITTSVTTTVDSLNAIVQDKEGNYYLTSWGDSYLYRCDSSFKNFTKLTLLNKPAGMYLNAGNDLLITLCHLCNKAEYQKLHYFEASGSVSLCEGDTTNVNLDISAEGIGTYNKSNRFYIDISDTNGSFKSKSTELGFVESSTQPKSIKIVLPKGMYGDNHNFRIRSTSPAFVSTAKKFTVLATPDASSVVDQWSLCKGSTVNLGKPKETDETYQWSMRLNLSDSTIAQPVYTASDTGTFVYTLDMVNQVSGCANKATVTIEVNPEIRLDLKRKVELCIGEEAELGVNQSPYSFVWSPALGLNKSDTSNPTFSDVTGRLYRVSVEDQQTGCKGRDSVQVIVHTKPVIALSPGQSTCEGDSVKLEVTASGQYSYVWSPDHLLSKPMNQSPMFASTLPGKYVFTVEVTDINGCDTLATTVINNNKKPSGNLVDISGTGNTTGSNKISISGSLSADAMAELYFINGKGVPVKIMDLTSLPLFDHETDSMDLETKYISAYMKMTTDSGCVVYSDTLGIMWGSVGQLDMRYWKVYPNPASKTVHVRSTNDRIRSIRLLSTEGRLVAEVTHAMGVEHMPIDVSSVTQGVYFMVIAGETKSYWHRIIVE